ncbi:fibronectin type III domain-containing protein [candidate division KSB1 bacterium]|nr:fibronectin type III domain-containing protein [candidate division KSB1 bacterium]
MNNIADRHSSFFLIGITLICLWMATATAGTQAWTEPRSMQAIVIQTDDIAQLDGTPGSEWFLYSFNSATKNWKQIPFQFDENGWEVVEKYINAESTRVDTLWTFFGEKDGILESGDELCFMVRDMGDKAADTQWISNYESKLTERIELCTSDPLSPAENKYAYLYRSNTLKANPFLESYMDYTEAPTDSTGDDIVYGTSYIEGHNLAGMINYWSVPTSFGGSGIDILDRIKYRVNVFFGFTVRITEDKSLKVRNIKYVKGPIRVIRQIKYWLVFPLLSDPIGEISFDSYYFPYHVDARGPSKRLSADWGINYMRQSFDLNQNAIGMKIYNPYNSGIEIDGTPESFVPTVADYPQMNWHLVTGAPGSFLMLYVLPDLGDTQELYYHDNAGGGTADGTSDTGDSLSYGDLGMAIRGTSIAGSFGMSYLVYFMEPDKDEAIGPQFLSCYENSLDSQFDTQVFDMVAPAKTTDLSVFDYTTQSITLQWTAPGDDGASGDKIEKYELKYSNFLVEEDTLFWWGTASTPKSRPIPLTPGETQTFTVTGLDAYQNYYFLLRAIDDAGNVSAFSNMASGTAVPVELSAFTAQPENGQIVLRWETASESNNLGFEIQRRTLNPETDWSAIGFVDGNGTTIEHHHYTFVDDEPHSGDAEYRLKQIDTDGSFAFSKAVRVNFAIPKAFALHQNYPNPFNAGTQIIYEIADTASKDVPVQLVIYSLTGAAIRTLIEETKAPGIHRIHWDGRDDRGNLVATGIYLYQLHAGTFCDTKKMLIIK